jgi:hypothetical protein
MSPKVALRVISLQSGHSVVIGGEADINAPAVPTGTDENDPKPT